MSQLARILEPGIANEPSNMMDLFSLGRRDGPNRQRTRRAHITDDQPPTPHPERYGANTRAAAREASESGSRLLPPFHRRLPHRRITQAHFATAALQYSLENCRSRRPCLQRSAALFRTPSVLQPRAASVKSVTTLLLSGDEQDLSAMRRVVETVGAQG